MSDTTIRQATGPGSIHSYEDAIGCALLRMYAAGSSAVLHRCTLNAPMFLCTARKDSHVTATSCTFRDGSLFLGE